MQAWNITPKEMCSASRDLFTFWEISDNILEAVQAVAMEV